MFLNGVDIEILLVFLKILFFCVALKFMLCLFFIVFYGCNFEAKVLASLWGLNLFSLFLSIVLVLMFVNGVIVEILLAISL